MPRPAKKPLTVEEFPIAKGIINILKKAGIKTEQDFGNFSPDDLKGLDGMGPGRLAELKLFLKGAKIRLKKNPPKEKKARKWDPRTREVMLLIQDGNVFNGARDMQMTGMMIEEFGLETMMNVRTPAHIQPPRVSYFFSMGKIAGWVPKYVRQFAKIKLIEEPITPQSQESVEQEQNKPVTPPVVPYAPTTKAPKSLADFLKQRKENKNE